MRVAEAQRYLSVQRERQRRLREVFPPVQHLTPELQAALDRLANREAALQGLVNEKR